MSEDVKFKSVLIKGIFHFIENEGQCFVGAFRRGLRPFVWYTQVKGEATSCALISDVEIHLGEKKEVEVFILNEFQLRHQIKEGMILSIGCIKHSHVVKFGELKILEHLGEWKEGRIS
ncbi:MAG: hypothetical protein ACTHLE_12495 [Agriterribacter sp.]